LFKKSNVFHLCCHFYDNCSYTVSLNKYVYYFLTKVRFKCAWISVSWGKNCPLNTNIKYNICIYVHFLCPENTRLAHSPKSLCFLCGHVTTSHTQHANSHLHWIDAVVQSWSLPDQRLNPCYWLVDRPTGLNILITRHVLSTDVCSVGALKVADVRMLIRQIVLIIILWIHWVYVVLFKVLKDTLHVTFIHRVYGWATQG